MRAAFRGALHLLEQSSNWEQYGSMTEIETAEWWTEANAQTFVMETCTETGACEMPVGHVIFGLWETAPDGYLLCQGQSILQGLFADLFDLIGFTFGGGAGYFNLPDMRRKFPVGAGSGYALGEMGGAESVALVVGELPPHKHDIMDMKLRQRAYAVGSWDYSEQTGEIKETEETGDGDAHENRPPFIAYNFAIKY